MLPVAALTAVLLLLLGWRRGALAWVGVVAACFGLVLSLKLGFAACGSPLPHGMLRSPSGHTMAGTVVYGGLLGLFWLGAAASLIASLAIAALIGWTRIALGDHTGPEALLGGLIGIAGVMVLRRLAGGRPALPHHPVLRRILLVALVAGPALITHGQRSHAEGLIARLAQGYVRPWIGCKPTDVR